MNTKSMAMKSLGAMFDFFPGRVKEPEVYKAILNLNLKYDLLTDNVDSHWLDVSEHIGSAFLELSHETTEHESLLTTAKYQYLNSKSGKHFLDLSKNLTFDALEAYLVKDETPNQCSTIVNLQETHLEANHAR